MKSLASILVTVCALFPCAPALAEDSPYDPLELAAPASAAPLDLTVDDADRDRDIPIRVFLPADSAPAPVVLFSHGLGGSREGGAYLGRHWSARGYVSVHMQHPGSDSSVWRGEPASRRRTALEEAAGGENYMLRVHDVPAVLDQLERWNAAEGHALSSRLDLDHVGMSGHSFGAATTQAVSGQRSARGRVAFTEPRIDAAVMFSPSSRRGDPKEVFGSVSIPWMLMTGTQDIAGIGNQTVESRLQVFPALPPDSKYELVLDGAQHSAFSDGPRGESSRNPNHHRVILALSTAFWDAYLRNDAAAKAWLDGDGPRSVMDENDRWQKK